MQVEIKRIHREIGITMIYVTHDQTEAMTMSDRVAVFSNGKVEQIGSPLEVANQGYSEIGAFTWSPVSYFPVNGLVTAPVTAPKPIPPGSIQPGGYINEPYTPTAVCAVSAPIANTTPLSGSLSGQVMNSGRYWF